MKKKRAANKKSQVTLFIILGIVILSIFSLIFYLVNYTSKEKFGEKSEEAGKTSAELKPIEEYIKSCLKETAEQGLLLLGKQGGYIY